MADTYTKKQVEDYLRQLYDSDDPVRHQMEALARERGFPIIGPVAGPVLFQLARMINARRVFELGSGFGYSALYFARAVGSRGVVHCTDMSAENIALAQQFLSQAGLWNRVTYHRSEATAALERKGGEWDLIYNDIDKESYPATIELAYRHLRPGGLFISDNLIWHGRIFNPNPSPDTQGVIEFTRQLFAHPGFVTTIYPVRDGLAVALKQ